MSRDAALRAAISLMSVPSQVRTMRAAPLPDGTTLLLGVAAGDENAIQEAMTLTGRTKDVVHSAAAFFIEQILLVPEADSYRILGTVPSAATAELRAHMALLMKWLHPDVEGVGQKALFAARVTRAWEDLKTPERRQAYDAARAVVPPPPKRKSSKRRSMARHQMMRERQPGFFARAIARLLNRDKPSR